MPKTAQLPFDFGFLEEESASTFSVESTRGKRPYAYSVADQQETSTSQPFKSSVQGTKQTHPLAWGTVVPSLEAQRELNRRIIAKTPRSEIEKIETARQSLVKKMYEEGLTVGEKKRLEYFRWQLDRFEEARLGPQLDYLERIVQAHETLAKSIQEHAELFAKLKKQKKGKRR